MADSERNGDNAARARPRGRGLPPAVHSPSLRRFGGRPRACSVRWGPCGQVSPGWGSRARGSSRRPPLLSPSGALQRPPRACPSPCVPPRSPPLARPCTQGPGLLPGAPGSAAFLSPEAAPRLGGPRGGFPTGGRGRAARFGVFHSKSTSESA